MSRWIQDAGHGGNDPGAVHYGQKEKEWALEAALYVHERLKELGISSDTTRIRDVTLPRTQRTAKVREYDKCISHHFNAGGGTGAEFIHSIYADGSFESILREEFSHAGYPFRRTFTRTYPFRNDLDYYFMHRETGNCRVTIVEYDFLDGPNRYRLRDSDYRFGMYECVVRAICREEGVEYIPIENVPPGTDAPFDIPGDQGVYRVISGSFHELPNAERRINDLKLFGFDSFISEEEINGELFYRAVVGSFRNRENADLRVQELKEEGFDSFIDLIDEEE